MKTLDGHGRADEHQAPRGRTETGRPEKERAGIRGSLQLRTLDCEMTTAIFPSDGKAIAALTVGPQDAETGRYPFVAGGVR